jgi:integrase
MATLVKDSRGRSPFWICCYTSADGKRLKKSTKQRDRKSAMEFCSALERAENAAKAGTFTEQTARKLLGEILERVTGEPMQNYKIKDWFEHWLKLKEKVRAEKTMSRYHQVVRDFIRSLGARADLSLPHLLSKDILNYRDSLRASSRTERTANLSVKVVSAALNSAFRQQHIAHNPALAVEQLKVRESEKRTFTDEQVDKLLENSEGDWRRAILFAYCTGARLSDVAKMRWENVDLQEKFVNFTQSKPRGKLQSTPLHSCLCRELLKQPGVGKAFLFPSLAAIKGTGGRYGLSGRFRQIMEKAGIDPIVKQRDDGTRSVAALSFHSFRHGVASELTNRGVPEETRMKLLGHSSREVHRGYSHQEKALLRAAIEMIPIPGRRARARR